MNNVLFQCPDTSWANNGAGATTHQVEKLVEEGSVLCFEQLPFELTASETRFLNPVYADGKAKNISLRANNDELRGAIGSDQDIAELHALLSRFRKQAETLVGRLFPHYDGHLKRGNASYRPIAVEGRATSWRKDDTRLHVDAFPSNPMRGTRILRVFTNVNPNGKPRHWRVGEPFAQFATQFLPAAPAPIPGIATVLNALGITKAKRSAYDHYMLHLHDMAKANMNYQEKAPQQEVNFAPGTTWVVFSDQVLHAAMGGQFMFEQTFYLSPEGLKQPETAPLAVLERMLGRKLLS